MRKENASGYLCRLARAGNGIFRSRVVPTAPAVPYTLLRRGRDSGTGRAVFHGWTARCTVAASSSGSWPSPPPLSSHLTQRPSHARPAVIEARVSYHAPLTGQSPKVPKKDQFSSVVGLFSWTSMSAQKIPATHPRRSLLAAVTLYSYYSMPCHDVVPVMGRREFTSALQQPSYTGQE